MCRSSHFTARSRATPLQVQETSERTWVSTLTVSIGPVTGGGARARATEGWRTWRWTFARWRRCSDGGRAGSVRTRRRPPDPGLPGDVRRGPWGSRDEPGVVSRDGRTVRPSPRRAAAPGGGRSTQLSASRPRRRRPPAQRGPASGPTRCRRADVPRRRAARPRPTPVAAAGGDGSAAGRHADSHGPRVFPSARGTPRGPDSTREQLREVVADTPWRGLPACLPSPDRNPARCRRSERSRDRPARSRADEQDPGRPHVAHEHRRERLRRARRPRPGNASGRSCRSSCPAFRPGCSCPRQDSNLRPRD